MAIPIRENISLPLANMVLETELRVLGLDPHSAQRELHHWTLLEHIQDLNTHLHKDALIKAKPHLLQQSHVPS